MSHDLSFDKVTLDYQELIKTAQIAYGRTLADVQASVSQCEYPNSVDVVAAKNLHQRAGWLAEAANTLEALQKGLSRSRVVIINKPELVPFEDGCPKCDNRDPDKLVFSEDCDYEVTSFELLGLWYGLGDGLGFSSESRYCTFRSRKSAVTFKRLAPTWTVGWDQIIRNKQEAQNEKG